MLYGVLGAIVLRALFIVAGVALLDRFEAMQYIFGALLLYAAWRLIRQKKGRQEPTIPIGCTSAAGGCRRYCWP